MGERGLTHGLKSQARAISAVTAEKRKSTWLVGTNTLREENEVQLLEYDPDQAAIKIVATYIHDQEIWEITASPVDTDTFVTVCNKGGRYSAKMWKTGSAGAPLQQLTELTGHSGVIRRVAWCQQRPEALISLEEGRIRTWALRQGKADMTADASAGELNQLWTGCWDPHNANSFCTTGANHFQVWDLRTLKRTLEVESAHSMPVRDINLSQQREHLAITAGDDAKVRYWDLRLGSHAQPLLETSNHRHWVWQARFSPFHDQLVLSCSSDSLVCLMHTPGIASLISAAPRPAAAPEIACKSFDDHEESVYGVAWSVADPWVFASLSYDGRVVVNRVPSQTKYKILL